MKSAKCKVQKARKKARKPGAGRPEKAIWDLDQSTPAGRLGAAIRAARQRRGLTVTGAAGLLGVPISTWSRWELGQSPAASDLAAIALVLGCRPAELLA